MSASTAVEQSARASDSPSQTLAARENIALHRIADTTADDPYAVLHGLLSAAVELCGGGAESSTAGVSMLEEAPDGSEQFRWVALEGCLSSHVGGTTPRGFSPCGECLDKGGPILITRPDLKYPYFQEAGLEFTEGLVVPFSTGNDVRPLGTIWVVSHPPVRHQFDSEDMRVMESIARFAASAYSVATERDRANTVKRQQVEGIASMSQEMRTALETIAGSVYILSIGCQGSVTNGQAMQLARIQKAVKVLLAGVNGLTQFASPGEGPYQPVEALGV